MAFVNFNGIDKRFVHEQTSKEGKPFVSVGIIVPNDVSRNGIANIAVTPAMVKDVKDNADKVNVGVNADWTLKVSVASYYNKEKPEDTKYKTVEMKPQELLNKHIEALKARKEATKGAEAEVENDGPEME